MPQRSLRSRHIAVTLLQLGLLGLTVGLVATGHGNATGHRNPFILPSRSPLPGVSPEPPPTPAFAFDAPTVYEVPSGSHNRPGAATAGGKVALVLSGFYDQAFVQPRLVAGGPPEAAWQVFASGIRDRARRDAASLALVTPVPTGPLTVTQAKLTVWVLLDPKGRPEAAVAHVAFKAQGAMVSGEHVLVTNRTRLLLRPGGGDWIVVAYPRARTSVSAAPTPSPTPSATPTTSPTPSPSGSR